MCFINCLRIGVNQVSAAEPPAEGGEGEGGAGGTGRGAGVGGRGGGGAARAAEAVEAAPKQAQLSDILVWRGARRNVGEW